MSPGRNEAFDFFFLINNDTEKESKELTVRSNRREKNICNNKKCSGIRARGPRHIFQCNTT